MKVEIGNKKKLAAVLLAATITWSTQTGCIEHEVTIVPDATEQYDTIDSTSPEEAFKPQIIDVPGEDFKLVIEYALEGDASKEWRITSDKKIYTKVYTKGLPAGKKVYIDNVHTDTTIISTYPEMNGITQDSMDDRIHNSLMYGFPISDTTCFYAVNEIEGQNDTFISGSSIGFNGYSSGSIDERRHTEREYLQKGVYANKIASVYGLLIQNGDDEPYGVDVSADVVVLVNNKITKETENGKQKVYVYDRKGNETEYTGSNK